MFSAGLAAVVAALMSWISVVLVGGTRPAWAASLQTFGLEIALAFLSAAVSASVLMPPTSDMTRPIRNDEQASTSPGLLLLLGALAAVALLQAPSIAAWWAEDRVLLSEAIGNARDPLGLNLIPAVILYSLPTLAAMALMAFVLTSILGMLVRADLAFPVLGAYAALQAGLVVGEQLVLHAMRGLGVTIQGLIAAASDPKASAQVLEWLARHDAVGADVSWRLVWILGGYVVAVAATQLVSPQWGRVHGLSGTANGEPEVMAVEAAAIAPMGSTASSAARAFEYSNYTVQPRWTLLESILRRYSTYDIQSIPPMSRARFSFSWTTGILRREPHGPDVLALKPAERQSFFGARSHLVMDVVTGAPLGTLRASGSDWEILDAGGTPTARVVDVTTGVGFAS